MTQKNESKKESLKLHRETDIQAHKNKANQLNQDNEEYGGQEGADPTRYGDWEKGGRCSDF